MPIKQKPAKNRVDALLVGRGLASDVKHAQALVMAGKVFDARGQRVNSAGALVASDAALEVRGGDNAFASRGGGKLKSALDAFAIDVRDAVALDVGASTGGFTDCLLQAGARKVFAVDVGYGLLAQKLRDDARVMVIERVNARELNAEHVPELVDIAVVDVSFISLKKVLPAIVPLVKKGGVVLPMVKPQFEAAKHQIKNGVIDDAVLRAEIVESVRRFCVDELGLECLGHVDSAVRGPEGNQETFLWLKK